MTRLFLERPVATWMMAAALILCGAYALPRLDIEAMPETDLPSLSIVTAWNGASPNAVQRSITVPVEEAARRCHGVEKIESRSFPGRSQVTVSFRREVNVEFARLELSEHLGAVRRNLPAGAFQPQVQPIVPEEFRTEEFFSFSLVSPLSAAALRERAEDWLLPRLLAIEGVADAELQGGARPLVKVQLDLDAVQRHGLTADGIFRRLAELDEVVPAGAVRRSGSELAVSVRDSLTVGRLRRAVLALADGQPLTLERVGEVVEGWEDPSYFVRINGQNVVQATVEKRSGGNAVEVSRRLRAALPELREAMPFEVSFEIDEDRGAELEDKLRELVYRSLAILGLLSLLLLVALRRPRPAAVVVAGIMLAIVLCLSLFYFCGVSVNFITISGLTVCFGMLLDNGILVLDSVHRRLGGGRRTPVDEALAGGTGEVAFPIMATTLTTVVGFLSFLFLSGRLALYYVPLAISVVFAMGSSILVAFGWMPVALRPWARRELARPEPPAATGGRRLLLRWVAIVLILAAVAAVVAALWQGPQVLQRHWPWAAGVIALLLLVGLLTAWIEPVTGFLVRFWPVPVVLTLGLFYGAWWAYGHEVHKGGFWRQGDPQELILYLERPVGTDVVLTSETMRHFEQDLLPLPEGAHMKTWAFENRGFMRVEFTPELLRSPQPELLRNTLILGAEEMGGLFIYIGGFGDPYLKGGGGGGQGNSLLKITGYNTKVLDDLCAGVLDRLERQRRVRNVRLTSGDRFEREGAEETVVVIDRDQLVAHRLTMAEIVGQLRRLLGVDVPWHMVVDGRDRQLRLEYRESEQMQGDRLLQRAIVTSGGETVRLGDLVRLESRPVLGSINREDQRYTVQINWEYIGTDRMRQAFLQDILAGIELPYGYTAEDASGEPFSQEEEEEMRQVILVTVLLIFMTLAALFESFTLPLLVLTTVPMALVGVVGIFWATDASFDSSARIGLVLLFGIVVNNAILLVNRFRLQVRELAARGRAGSGPLAERRRLGGVDLRALPGRARRALLYEAIRSGTRIQLRSILLTSGTTIAGLLPLLIQLEQRTEQGKDIWENLALASIGGLAGSTLLILAVMPALYWAFTRLGWVLWPRRRLHRRLAMDAIPRSGPVPEGGGEP